MSIRPEIVTLLTDRDPSAPGSLRHADGRRFTDDECDLYATATPDEYGAAFEQLRGKPAYAGLAAYYEQRAEPDYREVMDQARARIKELTAPYWAGLPDLPPPEVALTMRVGEMRPDLLARMPEAERAEVEALAAMISPPWA